MKLESKTVLPTHWQTMLLRKKKEKRKKIKLKYYRTGSSGKLLLQEHQARVAEKVQVRLKTAPVPAQFSPASSIQPIPAPALS